MEMEIVSEILPTNIKDSYIKHRLWLEIQVTPGWQVGVKPVLGYVLLSRQHENLG